MNVVKGILASSFVFFLSGFQVFAQETSAGAATFAGSITLWIAVIAGFICSILTLLYSMQMKGSTVGAILAFFGIGMLLIVAGFFVVVVKWGTEEVQMIVHDLLFIAGYLSILLGVFRIKKLGF